MTHHNFGLFKLLEKLRSGCLARQMVSFFHYALTKVETTEVIQAERQKCSLKRPAQ